MSITKPVEESTQEQLPFHPCLTPRGMQWYDLSVLTSNQQRELNELKVNTIRENNRYLAQHPEIRAIISIFARAVMKEKSLLVSPAEYASLFFNQPKDLLQECIDNYLTKRGEPLDKEGDSAMNVFVRDRSKSSSSVESSSRYFSYKTLTDQSALEYFHDWYSDLEGESFYSSQTTSKTMEYLAHIPHFDGESNSGFDADSIDFGFFELVKNIQETAQYEGDEIDENAAQMIQDIIEDALQLGGEDIEPFVGEEINNTEQLREEINPEEILGEIEDEGHIEPPVTEDDMLVNHDTEVIDDTTAELTEATINIVKSVLDAGT